jgi:hypothetical protein
VRNRLDNRGSILTDTERKRGEMRLAVAGNNSLKLRSAAEVAYTRGEETFQRVCGFVLCRDQCLVAWRDEGVFTK